MATITIGVNQGSYTVNAGTRQVTISSINFTPTVEGVLYFFNITQGKLYYAPAEGVNKEITVTASGDDWILTYADYSAFPLLVAGDKIHIQMEEPTNVQYPLPVDGDSVYAKDIWVEQSDKGNFVGSVMDLFNDLHTVISDSTSNNPKTLLVHFKRTIVTNVVGLGAFTGNFSNVKIEIINSGNEATTVIDESSDNTKYTTQTYQLPVTAGFNAIRFTFATADTVTLSNLVILKTTGVVSRQQAVKPDGTVIDVNATTGGNLKFSLEELESAISVNSNSQLRTTLYDSLGNLIEDSISSALKIVDYSHHEIHRGSHYYYTDQITLGNGASQDYLITTPDSTTWSHFLYDVTGSLGVTIGLYEGADRIGTTPQTIYNNNRNSINTSVLTIHKGQSGGTTDGTNIHHAGFGSATVSGSGGALDRDHETVLKQNTKYIFRVTNRATNNNIVSIDLWWYEHANKV